MYHLLAAILVIEGVVCVQEITPDNDIVDIFSNKSLVLLNNVSNGKIENYPPENRYDTVRRFLKHYNSLKPVAVLVDDTEDSFSAARDFMTAAFEIAPNSKLLKLFFSIFNTTGITPIIELNSTENNIVDQLNRKTERQSSHLGNFMSNSTVAFFAILNAAAVLPDDGAILIFLDRRLSDEDLASHSNIVRQKNIKVYVIWGGPYPTKSDEEKLLNEFCTYSGGLFLVNGSKSLSSYNYRSFLETKTTTLNTSVILCKRNISGDSEFTFPIDSEVTAIHLSVTSSITSASLTTPSDREIDLLNNDEVAQYEYRSFGITIPGLREVYLDISPPTMSRTVGFWKLNLNSTVPYDVIVFVRTTLIAQTNFMREHSGEQNLNEERRGILMVGLRGFITKVNNISFVDIHGKPITNKVQYNFIKDMLLMENSSDNKNKKIDVKVSNIPQQPFHVLVQGNDAEGNPFARLTYVNGYSSNNIFPQPRLYIEVGLGSQLITSGGKSPIITFEVTNYMTTAADVRFYCKDERSLLLSMQPYRKSISPQETITVQLTLTTKYGTYQDTITFSATAGSEVVEKKVIVDVGTELTSDKEEPSLDYTYLSDCSKVVFSSCDKGTWSIEVKAKDTGSGLLQVTSIPKGLYFPNGFTTGTKEEVTGSYSDSCCNADIQLIAVDRMNNRKSLSASANHSSLGPAQISAIVLGILLLIVLIIVIVYFVRRRIKKRECYDLPTYRSGGI